MKTLTITGAQFADLIAHICCMSQNDFIDAFGEEGGEYQLRKFRVEYSGNVAKWVTYLDNSNVNLLFKHFERYMESLKGEI